MATSRMVSVTGVSEWRSGELRQSQDYLAAEEPLEIRVAGEPISVTMRTPGHDLELAIGFLFTEGLISDRAQIASVAHETNLKNMGNNRVLVELAPEIVLESNTQRKFYAASSCGICGKVSIDAIRVRRLAAPDPDCRVEGELLCRLPEQLRSLQRVFSKTGGLHAAGLFSVRGELQVVREDIGRHNAVDKIVGWALANSRVPLAKSILLVSSRCGFEIVQKALSAGIAVLASVSAPSDLAVKLAREYGMTLVGFLRGKRFVIYSGAKRLTS